MTNFRKILTLKNHVAHYYDRDGQRRGTGSFTITRGNVYIRNNIRTNLFVDFIWPHTYLNTLSKVCLGRYPLNVVNDTVLQYSLLDYFSIVRYDYLNKLDGYTVDDDVKSSDFTVDIIANKFIAYAKHKIYGVGDYNLNNVELTATSISQLKSCNYCGFWCFRFRPKCIKCNNGQFRTYRNPLRFC